MLKEYLTKSKKEIETYVSQILTSPNEEYSRLY